MQYKHNPSEFFRVEINVMQYEEVKESKGQRVEEVKNCNTVGAVRLSYLSDILSSSFLIQPGRFVVIPSIPNPESFAASSGSSTVHA